MIAALGGVRRFVGHTDAVRLGRQLVRAAAVRRGQDPIVPIGAVPPTDSLFAIFSNAAVSRRPTGVPLALSSTLHASLIAFAVFLATFNLSPRAASLRDERPADPMRLVFLATPGPGGGGGGGGLLQKAPPPKALREGRRAISSPVPVRREPKPIAPVPAPPNPSPSRSRRSRCRPWSRRSSPRRPTREIASVSCEQTPVENDSHGPGRGGGAGSGTGTGLGAGDGSGIGPGSGGGTGGGPYRPGSGIEPPRLLREVKADYTEDARQRGISGDVVLEIVVRRDGSVGDVKILQGLAGGLNDRAVQAVRQWRFSPAHRQGAAVDVIVEVAVEFKLR